MVRQISDPAAAQISAIFKRIVQQVPEKYVPSDVGVETDHFAALGLTDAVVLAVCSEAVALLTADLDLYVAAKKLGIDATIFNHIRELKA